MGKERISEKISKVITWHSIYAQTLKTRFFSALPLVVHHPPEECCIHPPSPHLLRLQQSILTSQSNLRLPLEHFEVLNGPVVRNASLLFLSRLTPRPQIPDHAGYLTEDHCISPRELCLVVARLMTPLNDGIRIAWSPTVDLFHSRVRLSFTA